jgi:hypothetical protein
MKDLYSNEERFKYLTSVPESTQDKKEARFIQNHRKNNEGSRRRVVVASGLFSLECSPL